jgi:hypothetical protein
MSKRGCIAIACSWSWLALGLVAGERMASATGVCGTPNTITCGQTLQGHLDTNSCLSTGNVYFDVYNFSGIQGQTAVVQISSPQLAPALSVNDPEGNEEIFAGTNEVESGADDSDRVRVSTVLEESSNQWTILAYTTETLTTGPYALSLSCINGSATCTGNANTLCLNQGRFQATATFDAGGGNAGNASVVPLSGDTGYLWFFSAPNVEVVLKVLDGCALNSHYWFFAGGLTNVHTVITVTDTANGTMRQYRNPANTTFLPIQDTSAFATCP